MSGFYLWTLTVQVFYFSVVTMLGFCNKAGDGGFFDMPLQWLYPQSIALMPSPVGTYTGI